MGQRYSEISEKLKAFIEEQQLFFVATAGAEGRVNVSPKGMDSLRVLGPNRVVWLNVTGSGNETSTHIQENPRMTLMWNSFGKDPTILRVYGEAKVYHLKDEAWKELIGLFEGAPAPRQIFDLEVDLVQTSCGFGVPKYEFVENRTQHQKWVENKGDEGIRDYWKEKNQVSLDGKPTNILARSL